jgi:uncharacterized membrane protein YhaH (DUF805 family)
MNMIEAIKTVFSKYATFSGRAIKSEFWWWVLFLFLVQVLLSILMFGSIDTEAMMSDDPAVAMAAMSGVYTSPVGILSIVWGLATLIPTFAVGARRLHDSGLSGWWQLLYLATIVPLLGLLVLIAMLYLFMRSSTEGENKYG